MNLVLSSVRFCDLLHIQQCALGTVSSIIRVVDIPSNALVFLLQPAGNSAKVWSSRIESDQRGDSLHTRPGPRCPWDESLVLLGGSAFSPSGTHENQHENHNMSPFAKLGSVGRPGVDKKRRRTVRRMLLKSRQFQRRRRRVFRQLLEEPLEWRILLTSVTGVNPPANSHSAQVSTDVAATFDRSINPSTATPQNFAVHSMLRGQLTGSLAGVSTAGATVTLNPTSDFFPGEVVKVSVTSAIQSTGGQGADSRVWQLRTAVPGGTGTFNDSNQSLAEFNSTHVALGDLDGDGDLDAFVTNLYQPNRVWINTGGTFSDSGQSLGNSYSWGVGLGDLDGDGDLDAFVANSCQGNRVWINQGGAQSGTAGTFSDSGQSLGNACTAGVSLGDVDGDGDLDAFVSNDCADNRVWINQGGAQRGTAGTFSDSGQSLGTACKGGPILGDLDGDGDLDAVVADRLSGNRVWINQGGAQRGTVGLFSDSGQILGGSQGSSHVKLGDLDGDGDLDAFVANRYGGNRIWVNSGGSFSGNQSLGTLASRDVDLGDLDGDGDLDAFVANLNGGNRIWINQGGAQSGTTGNFIDSGQSLGNSESRAVALGDLNGDGTLDAFIAIPEQGNRVWLGIRGNQTPTINAIANLTLKQGAGAQTVLLEGITAGIGDNQPLKVTASSSNASLIPHPTVNYTSPQTTGTLTFTPVASATGTAIITVTVEDGGLDGDLSTTGDNATVDVTFEVTVTAPATRVIGAVLNGGSGNRSRLTTLTMDFSSATTVSSVSSLKVRNHTTGAPLDISAGSLENNGTTSVTWNVSNVAFPAGNYTAELPKQVDLAAPYAVSFHVQPGDVSGDRSVNFVDFGLLSANFGQTVGPHGPGDLNGDGVVNFVDFGLLSANFGVSLSVLSLDFGDAPAGSSYPTTLAEDGARHVVGGLFLGSTVDGEANGQPSANASGDDSGGGDEDGVTYGTLQGGKNANITVTASAAGLLNSWIDYNADGDWDDAGEQVFADQALSSGVNNLTITIPANATAGTTFARHRLTSGQGYSYSGLAPDGEVEDDQVTIVAAKATSSRAAASRSISLWAAGFVAQPSHRVPTSVALPRHLAEPIWSNVEFAGRQVVDLPRAEAVSAGLTGVRASSVSLHEQLTDRVFEEELDLLQLDNGSGGEI